jgi:uncharacterized phage infection (PIP) family protein YhgE
MEEDKSKSLIDKIEGLIVDGQKVVLERLDRLEDGQRKLEGGQRKLEGGQRKLEDGQRKLEDGQRKLEDGQRKLEDGQREIVQTIKAAHASLKKEIETTSGLLDFGIKEVDKKVEMVKAKLEEHMRQPAHAGR